ncbi:MAG: small ribosomal subunit Rsm22 family protein [Bdellovibrionota bacterium]
MFHVPEKIFFPPVLDQALVRFFWNGESPYKPDFKSKALALKQLWPKLAKQRGQAQEKHYSIDEKFAQTYAAYYLPANLLKLPLVLEEMKLLGLELGNAPLRWVDFGTGPGTVYWGLEWWASRYRLNFEFWGVDQSKHFLDLGQKLSVALRQSLVASGESVSGVNHWEKLSAARSGDGFEGVIEKVRRIRPHAVSFMNSIAEFEPEIEVRAAKMLTLVDELARFSKSSGDPVWLILIEPGSQNSSRELLELRRALLQHDQIKVWLPCLSDRPCGALQKPGDWCHEEVECEFPGWLNDIGAEAGLRKESLLFSYLVCSVGNHPSIKEWPSAGVRVVSQMMHEKGLDACFLCTQNGKIKGRVLKSARNPQNEGFLSSVRGDLFDRVELDEKGSVLSYEKKGEAPSSIVFPRPR